MLSYRYNIDSQGNIRDLNILKQNSDNYKNHNTILQSSFRYVNWARLMSKLFGGEPDNSQLFLLHFPSFLRQLDRLVSLFGVR